MFLERKYVDFEGTYKEFYERYKPLISSVTAQTVLIKNSKTWKGFFRLLELKKRGKLQSFIKVNPPGYKKRDRSRTSWDCFKERPV